MFSKTLEIYTPQNITISEHLFTKDNIDGVTFYTGGVGFKTIKPYWYAKITFKVGDMNGSKEFRVEGLENFHLIVKNVEDFIQTL